MKNLFFQAKDRFLDIARKVGNIQKQCELRIPVEDYVDQFKFGLMEVVFEWARGMVRLSFVSRN